MAASPGAELVTELGLVVLAAFVGGATARVLRLPVIVGYFTAGLVIGPGTPGFVADPDHVRQVSNIGVALLMFAVGVQLHLSELRAIRRTALLGGGLQILLCLLLGPLLGSALGWPLATGLFVGGALALSSTAVVMKLLEDRGELGSNHGRVAMGYLVVQDLSLILFVACLPLLAGKGTTGLALDVLRPAVLLGLGVFVALRVAPPFLDRVARLGSRELFVLAVVTLCLTAGFLAERVGLGVALGAFFAGLVISESSYAQEVFSQVRPLRDVFASVFFVSVGMMLDPGYLVSNLGAVFLVIAAVLFLKPLTVMIPLQALGWQGRTVALSGLYLANIGEFSFVLAMLGQQAGVIDAETGSLIVAAALVTLGLAPFLMQRAGGIYYRANQVEWIAAWLHRTRHDPLPAPAHASKYRAVVLGGGRVGRYVSEALSASQIPHVVVDLDVRGLERLQSPFMQPVYGDATSQIVLRKAHPKGAELAVLALPDADSTGIALRELKRLSPDLYTVARVHRGEDIPVLRALGADAVIHGEFEAGAETIRQALRNLGVGRDEVRAYLDLARSHRYREDAEI